MAVEVDRRSDAMTAEAAEAVEAAVVAMAADIWCQLRFSAVAAAVAAAAGGPLHILPEERAWSAT